MSRIQDAWEEYLDREGVDRNLLYTLIMVRDEIDDVGKDGVLLDSRVLVFISKLRPSNLENFGLLRGVGSKRIAKYGMAMIHVLDGYCAAMDLDRDCFDNVREWLR